MAEDEKNMRDITVISSGLLMRAMGGRWIRAQYTLIRNGWTYDPVADCFKAPAH